jgi:hypothetical protein
MVNPQNRGCTGIDQRIHSGGCGRTRLPWTVLDTLRNPVGEAGWRYRRTDDFLWYEMVVRGWLLLADFISSLTSAAGDR